MNKYFQSFFAALFSAGLALLAGASISFAASTISTDISTGGTLTATGLSLFNGNASTTQLSALTKLYVGNTSTTTILGNSGTSTFSGGINLSSGCFAIGGACISLSGGNGITLLNGLSASTQSFATGTDANITISVSSSGSTHTFTPGWTGALSVSRGGTGISSAPAFGELLVGQGGGTYSNISTSSLGLLTTNVLEGANLYFTDARAISAVTGHFATTTSANIWSATQTFVSAATTSFSGGISVNGGGLYVLNGGLRIASLVSCDTVDTNANGVFTCGTDATSGGGTVNSGTVGEIAYYAGATTISGTSTMFVDVANARVGIGTTTPGSKLSVANGLSIGANYGIAAPGNGAIIEGNVGIGTTSPVAKLSVVGNTFLNGDMTLANSSTPIGGIVFGSCGINGSTISPSSSENFDCTASFSVSSAYNIFIQSDGSLYPSLFVQSASSTGSNVISIQIYNASSSSAINPGTVNFKFFGIR